MKTILLASLLLLLAVATAGAFSAATWYYGKNEGWRRTTRRLMSGLTFTVLAGTLLTVAYYTLQPPSPMDQYKLPALLCVIDTLDPKEK